MDKASSEPGEGGEDEASDRASDTSVDKSRATGRGAVVWRQYSTFLVVSYDPTLVIISVSRENFLHLSIFVRPLLDVAEQQIATCTGPSTWARVLAGHSAAQAAMD